MAFSDTFKVSSHAIITNSQNQILQLKSTYGNGRWGLPGGSPEPGENLKEALIRECLEELGIKVTVKYLSGLYYHKEFNSHVAIFRCELPDASKIKLSSEHSEYAFKTISELSENQQIRVNDCLNFTGEVVFRSFN
jgi:8-oxo-dGTP pyrophosphatase MutT (NUDIX family)